MNYFTYTVISQGLTGQLVNWTAPKFKLDVSSGRKM